MQPRPLAGQLVKGSGQVLDPAGATSSPRPASGPSGAAGQLRTVKAAVPVPVADVSTGTLRTLTTLLVCSCELGEPRQSGVFFEPSLWADDRGEGGEAVATGSRQTMVSKARGVVPSYAARRAGRG